MPPERALRLATPSAEAAAAAATAFLLAAQGPDGSWRDFLLPAGASSRWVAGFVAGVLAARPEQAARKAAGAAWSLLEHSQAEGGGWSYNPAVPGDADSTLWVLRLAQALNAGDSDAALGGYAFLRSCLRPDGGLATYPTDGPIRSYVGLPAMVPFDGWTQSHVCVSAAGANLADAGPGLVRYLLARQRPDGAWPSYWWFEDAFATAEAVSALDGFGAAAPIARAVEWAQGETAKLLIAPASARPPAFLLALLVRILSRAPADAPARPLLRAAVDRLVSWQLPDGAFPASARLRVPRPDRRRPDDSTPWKPWKGLPPGPASPLQILAGTFDNYSVDHFRLYTTATALRALGEATEALADG